MKKSKEQDRKKMIKKFTKFIETLKENVPDSRADLMLQTGKLNVLKQDKDDYDRGLLVRLNKDGSYSIAYWANELVPYPIEVLLDGKSVKKDAKIIKLNFHQKRPEKEDD